jgi:aminoglycoside phosphotransferase (APT) family kinase protein
MESLTKTPLAAHEIVALVRSTFGSGASVQEITPANEGWFNAGYALRLAGAGMEACFLKVAPPADVGVLTYENGLMRTEAMVMAKLADARVPAVPGVLATDFSRRIVDRDCLFMALVEGTLFSEARSGMCEADRLRVRRQIGRVCGAANRVINPVFGYPAQPGLQAPTWGAAFAAMVAGLVSDAHRFQAPLADRLPEIVAGLGRAAEALVEPAAPRLCHFDLWDNNVLVRQAADGWELAAVLDWERAFFGDPLADLVAVSLIRDTAERAAALEGLAEGRGEPCSIDAMSEPRIALYRAYLWLIMIVEAGPRGFGGSIRMPGSSAEMRLERDMARALNIH